MVTTQTVKQSEKSFQMHSARNGVGFSLALDLGWLNTTKTDFYFELLFVDNESDMQKYNQNADKAKKSIS